MRAESFDAHSTPQARRRRRSTTVRVTPLRCVAEHLEEMPVSAARRRVASHGGSRRPLADPALPLHARRATPAPVACRGVVCAGRTQRARQYEDRDLLIGRRRQLNRSITLPRIGEYFCAPVHSMCMRAAFHISVIPIGGFASPIGASWQSKVVCVQTLRVRRLPNRQSGMG